MVTKNMSHWDAIYAVQRMQAYIDAHLQEKLTLELLAEAAGYSPWHSLRIFKQLMGKTPFEYIRAMRLSKAALLLRDAEPKVVDVAFDAEFNSHEGFTRAFSKAFGLSPKRYSQKTPPIQLFLPTSVVDYYRYLSTKGLAMPEKQEHKTVFVQMIERPARKVLLKRGVEATEYFAYSEEVGCDVWSLLCSVKEALYEPIGMWLPDHLIKHGTSRYVQGVEVPLDYANTVPDGFELVDLPPCKLLLFQGEPYQDEDFMYAVGAVMSAIDRYDPTANGYRWAPEAAPRFQYEPRGNRGYIEARPVDEMN
jgi:AraC-like DNA-binding protein